MATLPCHPSRLAQACDASASQCSHLRMTAVLREVQMDDISNRPASFGLTPPEVLASMSGLDFLRKMFSGELPHATMMQQVGFTHGSADPGVVVFQAIPGPQHYNPIGSVHGGFAATL